VPSGAWARFQSDLNGAEGLATGRGVTIALLSTGGGPAPGSSAPGPPPAGPPYPGPPYPDPRPPYPGPPGGGPRYPGRQLLG